MLSVQTAPKNAFENVWFNDYLMSETIYRMSEKSFNKKKIKYRHQFSFEWDKYFSFERIIFKVLFDNKMSYMYCSKVSSFQGWKGDPSDTPKKVGVPLK